MLVCMYVNLYLTKTIFEVGPVYSTSKSHSHSADLLKYLDWLPVPEHIKFKIAMLAKFYILESPIILLTMCPTINNPAVSDLQILTCLLFLTFKLNLVDAVLLCCTCGVELFAASYSILFLTIHLGFAIN